MIFFKVLVKELIESVIRACRLLVVKNDNVDITSRLKNKGLVTIPNFLSESQCLEYIEIIDKLLSNTETKVWCDKQGADQRIYFVNEINQKMAEFYNNPEIKTYLNNYLGISEPVGMLLASKILFTTDNIGSGGGWHRDSPIKHQFKAICYLNNVTEENGCFQYIKASHRKSNILKAYISKLFKFGQYRFTEKEIENYCTKSRLTISSVTGNAGDLILTDTKGIHRGKPLDGKHRYVLFCYFWDKKTPQHFDSLRQK